MSLNTLAIYVVLALMAIVAAALGWEQLSAAASSDAARRSADADKAMAQVVSDQARIGDKISGAYTPLKGADPATKVTTADSIRKSIDAVQPDLDQSSKLIGGDQGAVRTAMTEANDRGVLGLLEGDKLDHKAAQLTSVMNALDIRADEISTAKGQLQLLEHLTTAEEHFGELGHALQNKDLASAQAIYNPANDAIKQAVTDAQAPNTPDAARTTVDQLNNLFEDTKAVMNSLQNGDLGGYDASLRAFLIHYENLLGIDPNGVRNGYDQLVKNYDQRYFSEMKDAGLPSSGGKSL